MLLIQQEGRSNLLKHKTSINILASTFFVFPYHLIKFIIEFNQRNEMCTIFIWKLCTIVIGNSNNNSSSSSKSILLEFYATAKLHIFSLKAHVIVVFCNVKRRVMTEFIFSIRCTEVMIYCCFHLDYVR